MILGVVSLDDAESQQVDSQETSSARRSWPKPAISSARGVIEFAFEKILWESFRGRSSRRSRRR